MQTHQTPEDQAIIDQFGGDIMKLAQSKRNSDSEFGKFRTQSIQSFVDIVKANPESIHTVPENLRNAVTKEVISSILSDNGTHENNVFFGIHAVY